MGVEFIMSEKSIFYGNMNSLAGKVISKNDLTGKRNLASLDYIVDNLYGEDEIFDEILNATYGIDGTLTIPTVTGTSYTYDGTLHSPTITGFDDEYMTKSGDLSATNAGDYTIIISLKDPVNYQWDDCSQTPKTFSWNIAKATISKPTLSKSTISFNAETLFDTFTVTRDGDGEIRATSSNSSKISTSVSGTTVTVNVLDSTTSSSAIITVTIDEGTNYTAYTDTDVTCQASLVLFQATKIYIRLQTSKTIPLFFEQSEQNGVTVDWGDGSTPETFGGYKWGSASGTLDTMYSVGYQSSGTLKSLATHRYSSYGDYVITMTPASGVTFGVGAYTTTGSNKPKDGVSVFGYNGIKSWAYPSSMLLKKFEGGTRCSILYVGSYGGFMNNTNITEVILPADTESIPCDRMINGCSALTSFTCLAETPPTIGSNMWTSVPAALNIYVPASSVAAYQAAQYWSNRAAHIQAIPNS